ncbi:transmembrane protein 52 isoform X2 [Hemicordylus capensis]|uniref:transmembrane protein 52 isoform X2 n=1 Tax=Hemicordylus capensis TaxID=884348 RepID=UPI002302E33D|nr:transmembrane protein 52 isoform X2 [Hemicordylus capensis]
MAALHRARSSRFCRLLLLALLQATPSFAVIHCTGPQECNQPGTSWTSLWYVWLILLTVFTLLMCGIGASCVKFCCRKKRPPVQAFPSHAPDLTIIPMDHDSTAHSTVTSYSSVQYPQSFPLPLPFREMDRNMGTPPAYSLYAIELPPSYDEAIKMAKPGVDGPIVGPKLDKDAASQPMAPEDQNQPPVLPEPPNCSSEAGPAGRPAVPEASAGRPAVPEASAEGQS